LQGRLPLPTLTCRCLGCTLARTLQTLTTSSLETPILAEILVIYPLPCTLARFHPATHCTLISFLSHFSCLIRPHACMCPSISRLSTGFHATIEIEILLQCGQEVELFSLPNSAFNFNLYVEQWQVNHGADENNVRSRYRRRQPVGRDLNRFPRNPDVEIVGTVLTRHRSLLLSDRLLQLCSRPFPRRLHPSRTKPSISTISSGKISGRSRKFQRANHAKKRIAKYASELLFFFI
jgi:hypothetical protein